jgi:hypothetical protein
MMFNEFGKKPPQFGDALTVADEILNSGLEFDQGILVYNRFRLVDPVFGLDHSFPDADCFQHYRTQNCGLVRHDRDAHLLTGCSEQQQQPDGL